MGCYPCDIRKTDSGNSGSGGATGTSLLGSTLGILALFGIAGSVAMIVFREAIGDMTGEADWMRKVGGIYYVIVYIAIFIFFWCIASLLMIMTLLAIRFPETPRVGVLRIETTRGDRLFITLLGSAFIHLGWLFFAGPDLIWGAMILSLAYAAAVFRWV